jgi:hypothetical protein
MNGAVLAALTPRPMRREDLRGTLQKQGLDDAQIRRALGRVTKRGYVKRRGDVLELSAKGKAVSHD